MGGRGRRTRIMCVNCSICVNTLRRYPALALDRRVTSLLCSWVYPQIITEDDYVCEACRDLAIVAVNNNPQEVSGSDDHPGPGRSDDQQAGPSRLGHTHVCLLCGCSTMQRQSDRILRDNPSPLHQSMINIIERRVAPRQIVQSDRVCHACWLRTQREARRANLVDEARSRSPPPPDVILPEEEDHHQPSGLNEPRPDPLVMAQEVVLPNYRRAANSNNHCVFPGCNAATLHGISDKLRATVLSEHNYYLPNLARVCSEHLMNNSWEELYESDNSINTFTTDQIEHVFSFVNAFTPTLDFDNIEEMDDRVFGYWMGRSKEQFNTLLEEVPRIAEIRRGTLGLAALIIKLRTGDSDDRLSTLLQVPRRTLEGLMDKVAEVLLQDFVPRNLGINHITREQLLLHNLLIPNGLYGTGDNVIVICDGTYIYLHKSSNYKFQKQSYSLHKYRNLLKPFLIVACDGYIVDLFGPYKAITSDADIMSGLFAEGGALRQYFRPGDVFILDRGFRDCITLLEGCGIRAYMPDSLLEGEHQLTSEQANRSRCVTICRWVVEAVNGHFKRDFKLFRQEYFHRPLPHMMRMSRIAAALLNRFGVRFHDNIYASQILDIIRERIHFENNLSNMVDAINMNRRTSFFQSITADRNNVSYFPTLEYSDLILFALGTYQIRQARSYYGEHIRLHGGYRIEVCSEPINCAQYNLRGSGVTTLIRGRIKSRHVTRRTYYVYVAVQNDIPGRTGITDYCCNCLVGRRTVGCCAHVMTLVWFLGWARYQQDISAPAAFLDDVLISDDED